MTLRKLRPKDDEQLMELELQLDALNSLLKKNEAYSNKLRTSLSRIELRHAANKDKLINLYARKDDLKRQSKYSNRGGGNVGLSQSRLNNHKIQGISFYSLESYERLDCIQAFELMNKKKMKDAAGISYLFQAANLLHENEVPQHKMDQFKRLFSKRLTNKESLRTEFILLVVRLHVLEKNTIESVDWVKQAAVGNAVLRSFNQFEIASIDGLELFQSFKKIKSASSSQPKQVFFSGQIENNKLNSDKDIQSEWTAEEDESLRKGVSIFGEKRWGQVATLLNGKEHTDIVQRWQKKLNPQVSKGRWSASEDVKLCVLFEYYGAECETHCQDSPGESKIWCLIASKFSSRTEVQIRERWCNLLNPGLKFTHWTHAEDSQLLMLGVLTHGQWARISRLLRNKTDNQVLRRWKLLLSDKHNVALIKRLKVKEIFEKNRIQDNNEQKEEHEQAEIPQISMKNALDGMSNRQELQRNEGLGVRKRNIFKTVSLKPCLADQIRKDNLHRSENKKLKRKIVHKKTQDTTTLARQKQQKVLIIKKSRQAVLTSTSVLDNNSSTIRSRRDEDEESIDIEETSNTSISFTQYPSALIDPLSNSYANQVSLNQQAIKNKLAHK